MLPRPVGDQDPVAPDGLDLEAVAVGGRSLRFQAVLPEGASADGSYGWDFGDGSPVSTQEAPTHTYMASGRYVVRLVHIASDGHVATAAKAVAAGPSTLAAPRTVAHAPQAPQAPVWAALGAAAAALGAAAWLTVRYGWPNAILVFFSRFRQADLARHPVRMAILDALAGQPAAHIGGLARLVDKPRSTVIHHLGVLVAAGIVRENRWPGGTSFSLVDPGQSRDGPTLPVAPAQSVLQAIRDRPGLLYEELVDRSGLNKFTARYHVRRLQRQGLVSTRRDGRHVRLFAGGQPGSGDGSVE